MRRDSLKPEIVTREIGPLSIRAAFNSKSVDPEKRTAEIVWTTGERVLRGMFDRFWEELSLDPKHVRLDRLNSGRAPLLNSHDDSVGGVLGVVESARLEKKRGIATVRFARAEDDPEADKIFRKVVDGIITNVSVGYRVHRFEQVEGGRDKIPVQRATDWEPYEVSLVGMGADAGAAIRSDSAALMPCDFVVGQEEAMKRDTDTNTEPEGGAPVAPVVTDAPPVTAEQNDDAVRAASDLATRAERERCVTIRSLCAKHKMGDLAEKMVADGTDLPRARELVLKALEEKSDAIPTDNHFAIEMGEPERDKFFRAAEAGIFERAGVSKMIGEAQKTTPALAKVDLAQSQFARMTLVDVARECLERRGVKTRGLDRFQIVNKALTHRVGDGMATASDFAVLLESAMGKVMLAAYATTPDTWRRFCAIKSVSDFRASNMYRNGSFGTLDAVSESGEFHHKAIPDGEKSTITLATKGNIIAITRKAMINDDLGAFNDLSTRFGRAAALSIESDVYALLALNSGLGPTQSDSSPLFDGTARANVGTGAALSAASLDADATILASQTDPSGNEILDLAPAVLLVPRGLLGQAKGLNSDMYDPDTANKLHKSNPVLGMFKDIVGSARLAAGSTRRYMFADPSVAPVIAVAFLEGQQAPVLESEQGFNVDGTQHKVRIDYAVGAIDWRGAVTNSGAA